MWQLHDRNGPKDRRQKIEPPNVLIRLLRALGIGLSAYRGFDTGKWGPFFPSLLTWMLHFPAVTLHRVEAPSQIGRFA
jgi:hypothetical protein